MCLIVCHFVDPTARLPSRYSLGTAKIASLDVVTVMASAWQAKVRLAESRDMPK